MVFERLHETVKGLRRRKVTPIFCPRCGSPTLRFSGSFEGYPKMFGIVPTLYVCKGCGYKGPIAMEIDEDNRPCTET